jgi:NitT/TauT family transport system substrate-binding protein
MPRSIVTSQITRRAALVLGATGIAAATLPSARADTPKIRIGFWPIASGLPFYAALELGYFKEAGLDVEASKFASATQVVEAMIAGRVDGSANGVASAALGLGEITSPGLFKIICSNPTNKDFVLDEVLVPKDSPIKSIAEFAGKRFGSGPGIQNVTLAKVILEKNGIKDPKVIELPIGQHVAALAAGQIDGVYTLEPTGTIGRLKDLTRVLEAGVIAKYVLGDEHAAWYGGSATLTTEFITKYPDVTKTYIAAYAKGVKMVKEHAADVRKFLKGYTGIEEDLASEVPMSDYRMSTDFGPGDVAAFQQFFDVFTDRGIFTRKIDVGPLMYRG